jgi:hypothetical protein
VTRDTLISTIALCAAMTVPATAAPGRAAVTTEQVAAAISGTGVSVLPEQVTLLTDVMTKSDSPTLNVHSIEPWGDHRMKVRMECASQEDCLPFYVSIRLEQKNGAIAAANFSGQPNANARPNRDPQSFTVRAGSRANLLLEGGHVHIRLSVVCLENGNAGQKIRVESKDPRQTYVAQVVDGGILRGNL